LRRLPSLHGFGMASKRVTSEGAENIARIRLFQSTICAYRHRRHRVIAISLELPIVDR